MIVFLLMTCALLVVIFALHWECLPLVFRTPVATVLRRASLAFLVLTILGLVLGPLVWQDLTGLPGVLLRIVAIGAVVQVLLVLLTCFGWLFRRLAGLTGPVHVDYGRRRLLRHAAAYPLLALAGGLYGGLYEKDAQVVREYFLPVRDLPADLRGLRLAQLSDVHLGWFFSLEDYRALLERTVAGAPDALVLTGDIFDDDALNGRAIALTAQYAARLPLGIWYVYGNHEHRRDLAAIEAALKETDIHLLVNEAQVVCGAERPLVFAGVDYPAARGDAFTEERQAYAAQAFASVPPDAVTVLLAHHPEGIDDGAAHGAALTLTGHTHGCQFGFLGVPLLPFFKYNRGFVRAGGSLGYVHSGNGSWFPCRIGCPPEIAYFTLRRA